MKALAISLAAGAVLCSVMTVPASAMPTANLAAAASDLSLGQSVKSARNKSRFGYYRYGRGYYGYGAGYPGYARDCAGYGFGPNSPCYP